MGKFFVFVWFVVVCVLGFVFGLAVVFGWFLGGFKVIYNILIGVLFVI